ncbi:olfactory receptor class A-like protein 1 [Protopterus annectens]|uniref:olfactory receptor class A-like protein 1 n=1 Tax=Protopterus annectens TaxID=7888 RepID=UPI001CFBD981|nr:olfactory receptor class A-like protein 1 [Protopterus annectens]
MEIRLTLKSASFVLLLIIGIPANFTILMLFLGSATSDKKLMPTDFILTKLSFVNIVVVLVRGIPQTLTALGMQKLFNDYSCKFVIFTYRVCRAMSVCTTAILSMYQCIILLPPSSKYATLKQKASQNIQRIFIFLWCINCIIYIPAGFIYSRSEVNSSIPKYTLNLQFCFVWFPHEASYRINGTIYSLRDFSFVGLMVLSSSYIVAILYKHNKKLQNIRSLDKKQGNSIELKAAKAVVMLVTSYVFLFGVDNAIWMYTLTVSNVEAAISETRAFLAILYSTVSPLLIIGTNKNIQQKLKCVSTTTKYKTKETTIAHITTNKADIIS